MNFFEKHIDGLNQPNYLYVVDIGETWLIEWRVIAKKVQIDLCIRFEGEIPLPRKGYKACKNNAITSFAKEIIEKLKSLSIEEIKR